ncbi:MAG: hypothetical protein JOY51_06150, partial [Nevskia sp.]|nr:hypothetical protein [Nevskia sp.]
WLIGWSSMYRYLMDVAITATIYVTLSLGLNVVVGFAGLLDLGFVAFYAVGAYTTAILTATYGRPFWATVPLAAGLAGTFGVILGAPTLPLRGDYLAIVTLGFGEIIRICLNNLDSLTNGPKGILGVAKPTLPAFNGGHFAWLEMRAPILQYYLILLIMAFTLLVVYRLNQSRIGRAWVAIREDEVAAAAMGVHTVRLKLLAFASGAFFAGFAGSFFAGKMGFVSPESFTFFESIVILAMVVLGGIGSIPGVVLGAVVLVTLPELIRSIPDLIKAALPAHLLNALPPAVMDAIANFSTYRMLLFGLAMILVMLFRPAGLLGNPRRLMELLPLPKGTGELQMEALKDVEEHDLPV